MKYLELSKTKLNRIYNNMHGRCDNENVKRLKPWYKDCVMCDEWKDDKYNFYDWVNDGQFYEIPGEETVHLDHDILVKGNKVYSPTTCVFVPKSINTLFGGTHKKTDNNLPIGVTQLKSGKYKASIKGIRESFDTPEEAFELYKRFKESAIIEAIKKYSGKVPYRLIEAMLNWKIEITD